MMNSRSNTSRWTGGAFCAALFVAASVVVISGPNEGGIHAALAATARLAFLFFWPSYVGGALASLFGSAFQPIKQRAREFGLAFASVLLVHLGLVTWLCLIGSPPDVSTFVTFGVAAAFAFLLVLFSIGRLQQALGSKLWRFLRALGTNYIAYAFAIDLLKDPIHGGVGHIVKYLPFAILAIVGPMLVVAAFAKRMGNRFSTRLAGSR